MEKQGILIIDDEPAITQSLKRSLREDYDVYTANTITEALEILKQKEIAVILTDQRMPDMQGVDFLQAARMVQPNSLSILLSGYSDVQALVSALNLGTVRGFVSKPWDDQLLLEKVDAAVKEYRAVFKNPNLLQSSSQIISEMQQQIDNFKQLVETVSFETGSSGILLNEPDKQKVRQDHEASSLHKLYSGQDTGVSARMLGLLPLREANPDKFEELRAQYMICMEQAFEQRIYQVKYPISSNLKSIANDLGMLRASPRDVIELHHMALQLIFDKHNLPRRQVYLDEGRLLALELMGNLVHYYRAYCPWPARTENNDA